VDPRTHAPALNENKKLPRRRPIPLTVILHEAVVHERPCHGDLILTRHAQARRSSSSSVQSLKHDMHVTTAAAFSAALRLVRLRENRNSLVWTSGSSFVTSTLGRHASCIMPQACVIRMPLAPHVLHFRLARRHQGPTDNPKSLRTYDISIIERSRGARSSSPSSTSQRKARFISVRIIHTPARALTPPRRPRPPSPRSCPSARPRARASPGRARRTGAPGTCAADSASPPCAPSARHAPERAVREERGDLGVELRAVLVRQPRHDEPVH
jgi:hypothetical protein